MSVADILLPSPPNTSHREHRVSGHFFQLTKPETSTPDESPSSLLPSSGNASRKRVEFSPWTNILDPPSSEPALDASTLKPIPRSRDCQTGVKSILKSQAEQTASTSTGGTSQQQLSNTMDSLVQSLGSNDKITSTDAYQSLAQLIKTYDQLPDDSDTRANVISISRSIKRDLSIQEHGLITPVDTNLATQALKVTVILVWSENLSPFVPDDFKIFITDRAIAVLAEHTLPKIIIVHYMHVLATQSFKPALFMSGTRTVKLLEALREITSHVQGKGVIAERLLIYQKMIEQAKPIMKARASQWLREVLTSLTSNVKDTRDKAISVCSRAVAAFPASSIISQAARDALTEDSKDRTLSSILSQRLERMISAKDEALQVPQIWSLVMLLCNSVDARLDTWTHTREWLRVIQRCFNCSDINVRIQAFPAWNRFIYIVKPHEASEAMMSMLAKPIAAQIERTGAASSSKGSRPPAVSSYCTLLYYAFRPAASHKQYTRSWNEYVVKMTTSEFLSKSSANADLCCRVLMALFWKDSNVSRIWNENRAHDNKLMDPEELPAIDCKWVRAKSGPILDIFRLLFKYSAWGPSVQHSDQAYVAKAWRSFLRAVRESACKEIKSSTETRKAMSACLHFLQDMHLWEQTEYIDDNLHQGRTKLACRVLITELGSAAILNACDAKEKQRYPDLLLTEILFDALNRTDTSSRAQSNLAPSMTDMRVETSLATELYRGFGLLGDRVKSAYYLATESRQPLVAILDSCSIILSKIPKSSILDCLKRLQHSLAVVIKDESGICNEIAESTRALSTWKRVSEIIIRKLSDIRLCDYAELDELIAAALSSINAFTVDELLIMWTGQSFVGESGEYGPLLTAAIGNASKGTGINLPGMPQISVDEPFRSQVSRAVSSDKQPPRIQTSNDSTSDLSVVEIQDPCESYLGMDQPEQVEQRRLTLQERTHETSRQKPYRESSLVKFLSFDSSPTNIDEADSHMPTEHPKDNRNRQRSDQEITFPDLRSSPHNRAGSSSRAPSADCEMARKIAASEKLPSTPTFARHAIVADDEALPSPTPKARKHVANLAEIEIPSSPPSVVANRSTELAFPQMDTLPSKMVDGDDLNMVDFDKTQEVEELSSPDVTSKTQITQNTSPGAVTKIPGNERTPDCQASNATDLEAKARFVESVGKATDNLQQDCLEQESVLDSDEDPSASQLSQDLDWHVMGEARSSRRSSYDLVENSELSRKRKRKDVNYAEVAERQSRKRISTGGSAKPSNIPSKPTATSDQPEGDVQAPDILTTPSCVNVAVAELSRYPIGAEGACKSSTQQLSSSPAGIGEIGEGPRRSQRVARITKASHTEASEEERRTVLRQAQSSESASVQQTKELIGIETNQQHSSIRFQEGVQTHISGSMDIMSALQTALDGLKNSDKANSHEIDLKAIDDLCFQIRFEAQEVLRRTTQQY